MTELTPELWQRVLEFAKAPLVPLPCYPSRWQRDWTREAVLAYNALCAAAREDLELAIAFRSEEILNHLKAEEVAACRFWHSLTRYRDFLSMLFGDDDAWPSVQFLAPPEYEPLFVHD